MQEMNARQQKGLTIAQLDNQIRRVNETTYNVKSQSGKGEYEVIFGELGWICSCPDSVYNGQKCKHAFAVEISLKLRETVQVAKIQPLTTTANCIYCGSTDILKRGIRHNKNYDLQRFSCKQCGRRFTINIGFEGMRATPQIITGAMQLYFTGESLRNVQKFIQLQGLKVSHVAVYKWIGKYVGLMEQYLEKIKPNVSDTWRADELYVKIKGNMKYLFAMMDDETRFWIAQEVADTKHRHDTRGLFASAREVAGKRPMTLITDGLPAYKDAYNKEFYTQKKPRTVHISAIRLNGDRNNNKMERLNGEFRDREKVVRGIKKVDSKILSGYQMYHNYIRPHEGLNGKTPADMAGIAIEGQNKWITIIQNATKSTSAS